MMAFVLPYRAISICANYGLSPTDIGLSKIYLYRIICCLLRTDIYNFISKIRILKKNTSGCSNFQLGLRF